MSLTRIFGALLAALIVVLTLCSVVIAEDGELMFGQYGRGDSETIINPTYDYNLIGKEGVAVVSGIIGGVAPQGIVVTPEKNKVTVTAGKLATETFRITNLGKSDVRVSVTIQPTTDRKILDRTTLDGKTELTDIIIPASSYENNYRDVTVTVNTDFAAGQENEDFYTLDLLIDGKNSLRRMHTFVVTVQPPNKVSPFSVLGLSVIDIPGSDKQCVGDSFTGEVKCQASSWLAGGVHLSLGMLLLILLITAVGVNLFVRWRRRRQVVRVVDEDGAPVSAYEPGEDVEFAEDDDEYDEDEGYRF